MNHSVAVLNFREVGWLGYDGSGGCWLLSGVVIL